MMKFVVILCLGLIFISCNSYTNKEKYELKVGETVEIYAATNSCCFYCLINETRYKHLKFVEKKTVDKGNENMEGNTVTTAYVFRAESIGKDTVVLKLLSAVEKCDSNDATPEMYMIEVK